MSVFTYQQMKEISNGTHMKNLLQIHVYVCWCHLYCKLRVFKLKWLRHEMHKPCVDLDEGVHPPPTPRKNKIYWIHLEKLPEICPPPSTHTHTFKKTQLSLDPEQNLWIRAWFTLLSYCDYSVVCVYIIYYTIVYDYTCHVS